MNPGESRRVRMIFLTPDQAILALRAAKKFLSLGDKNCWRGCAGRPKVVTHDPKVAAGLESFVYRMVFVANMMFASKTLLVAWITLIALPLAAQPIGNGDKSTSLPRGAVLLAVPEWVPVPISPEMYWWWRKYGPWDYKVQSSQFRAFTSYNFGATGAAAKIPQQALLTLAQAAAPLPSDISLLDQPNLVSQYNTIADGLETLRKMTMADERLTRIAIDFTWLKDKSNWPRDDVGLTAARWSEYRALFEKLHIQEGIVRMDDFPRAIFFVVRAKGLCIAGSSSGYVYSEQPLAPVSETPLNALDTEARSHSDQGRAVVFRPLKSNWYAFYQLDW
jgi:hypothetical protein